MKALNIKQNNPFLLPAKLVNLLDFNPKDMSMNVLGNEELDIFYVKYDGSPLYLVTDDIRGFIEFCSVVQVFNNSFSERKSKIHV